MEVEESQIEYPGGSSFETRLRRLEAWKAGMEVKMHSAQIKLDETEHFIDRRIEIVDENFKSIDVRLQTIEKKIYMAAGALGILQMLIGLPNIPGIK